MKRLACRRSASQELHRVLQEHFDRYFEIARVRTDSEREEVFRLRHAVYCQELRYEDASAFPDGMERDEYDDAAEFALLRYRITGRPAGCVRIITTRRFPELRFPFERVCADRLSPQMIDLAHLDRTRSGEISRLAVHADFRRRAGEWQTAEAAGDIDQTTGGARRFPMVPMSLFLAAAAMGLNLGLAQVFVLMEPRLARLLSACGLAFDQVGDLVDHHGRRGPFRIDRASLERGLSHDAQTMLASLQQRLA